MRVLLSFYRYNLLSVMEYRASFITLVVFMILNDAVFLSIWYFLFDRFHTVRGMTFGEFIPLLSIFVLIFAFMHIFSRGVHFISDMIRDGQLDHHLLLPGNIVFRILASSLDTSAIGDLIYGLLLLFLIPNISTIVVVKIILFALIGVVGFTGFMLAIHSLSFYFGHIGKTAQAAFEWILGPSHYPPQIFDGSFLKIIFMTILPVYFIGFLPFHLVSAFDWLGFTVFVAVNAALFLIGYFTFSFGLRQYESGNMMTRNG